MSFIEPDPYEAYRLWKAIFEGDPPVPSTEYRAMMIRHGKSGFPADVFVNTFYFVADEDKATAADDITDSLTDFLQGANTNQALGGYLSQFVNNVVTIKVYKMSDPHSVGPPKVQREPTIREFTTSAPPHNSTPLPEECAVCLSFAAASPHTARRRGRLYIGPLNAEAMAGASGTSGDRVAPAFANDLANAAQRLANRAASGWIIAHDANGTPSYSAVETGWIDNAFDIQRRRGPVPSSRITWSKT